MFDYIDYYSGGDMTLADFEAVFEPFATKCLFQKSSNIFNTNCFFLVDKEKDNSSKRVLRYEVEVQKDEGGKYLVKSIPCIVFNFD